MVKKAGFSKVLSLIFVLGALGFGAGVYWYYAANVSDEYSTASASDAEKPAPTPSETAAGGQLQDNSRHMITISTSMGDITFETYDSDAPNTVKNFITLAQKGFYNGVIFHRIIKGFMIQGGDPTGTGRGGPGYTFADELNPQTKSFQAGYKKGVVAMANAGPNTNGSQFFIMLADYPLPNLYTIFGKVVSGQEVVDKIGLLKTDSSDRPLTPPTIQSVKVEER